MESVVDFSEGGYLNMLVRPKVSGDVFNELHRIICMGLLFFSKERSNI